MKFRDLLREDQCKEIWKDLSSHSATKKIFDNILLYTEIEVSNYQNSVGKETVTIQAKFYDYLYKKSINYIKFISVSFEKPKFDYLYPATFLNAVNDLLNTELEINLEEPGNLFKKYLPGTFYMNLMDFYTNEVFVEDIEKKIISLINSEEAHVSKCLSDSTIEKILNIKDIKLTHYYNTNEEELVITEKNGNEIIVQTVEGTQNIAQLFDNVLRNTFNYFETKVGPINYEDILK